MGKSSNKKKSKKCLKLPKPFAPRAEQMVSSVFDDKVTGYLPLHQSQWGRGKLSFTPISEIQEATDEQIWIRARVHSSKGQGKIGFCALRQTIYSIQATLAVEPAEFEGLSEEQIQAIKDADKVKKKIIKFMGKLPAESIVIIQATVVDSKEEITSCSIKNLELVPSRIYCVSRANPLPFTMSSAMIVNQEEGDENNEDQSTTATPSASDETKNAGSKKKTDIVVGRKNRLDHRWVDIRTPVNQAIFKVKSAVARCFREFLYKHDFTEIHTPKLIATASEGGSEVFEVSYFDKKAYLAQSPQLYKQTALTGDLRRVFEIGPVFRAEKSFTSRHLTEFVGLDFEMEIEEHYHEVIEMIWGLFSYIFSQIPKYCKNEIELVSNAYGTNPIVITEKPLILTFKEGIDLLKADGDTEADYNEDLSSASEKRLGELVKEKFNTDFFVLDKYPATARPFYTMKDPTDNSHTLSYDAFIRGQEVLSGAQRVNSSWELNENAKSLGVDLSPIKFYVDAMSHGAPPHGGCGIGLERVTMLILGLPTVKECSLFPRTPLRLNP